MPRPCPACGPGIQEAEIQQMIEAYIDHIPIDCRTADALYRHRMAICRSCTSNFGGMCRICGCYVALRAARRVQICPHPAGDRWI